MTARRPFIERHSCLKELAANTAFPSTCKRETKPISRYRCKCCKRRLMEATKASSARRQEGTYCTTSNESAIEMKRSCSRNMVQRASPEFPVLGAGSLLLLLESLNDSIPRADSLSRQPATVLRGRRTDRWLCSGLSLVGGGTASGPSTAAACSLLTASGDLQTLFVLLSRLIFGILCCRNSVLSQPSP